MTRKTMSIIGRIIGLILVVALAFGITWCATNWGKVQAEWDKLTGKDQQQEQVQPGTEEPGQEEPGTEEPHVHELSEWNIVVEPTCDSIGQEKRACDCGYYEEREIPALGHIHENGHICPTCGSEVEKILTWSVITPATCTTSGEEIGECICGYNSEVREIPALGHDYVDGTCSRCGETDPNHVVAPVSLDGMYYFIRNDGVVLVNQIEGDKYVQFTAYFRNGDQSVIYLPQDYEGYIENGYTLSITETDTNIVASIVEIPSLGEYFNYDKTTQTLYVGGTLITKITNFEILPYEEPTFSIVDNKLLLTDMTQYEGTYSIYYKLLNASEGEDTSEYAYVAGNVTEFDLNLLINRDYMPMSVGRDYRIRVAFQTDGFDIYGGVASYTASVETEPDNSSSRYEHYCMMTDDMFENMDKAVINCTWKGQEYEVELTWADHINGYFYSWADAGIIISKVNDEYLIYTDGNIDASEFEINSAIGYFSNLGFETSTII